MTDAISSNHSPAPHKFPIGAIAAGIVAILAAAPMIAVLTSLFQESDGLYLVTQNGFDYFTGTILLCVIVGIVATVVGAGTAALIAMTDFPGRRVLSFAIILPFAIPSYIVSYTYADLLSPLGVLAGFPVPEIRNLPGAAFILTLGVYPYIYLAMRAGLAARSGAFLQAARSLGAKPFSAIRRVIFPLSRPALAGGLALALMETTADYGVADYYGIKTLSTGIFRTWYGLGDLQAASQLAAGLLFIAIVLVMIEQVSRRGRHSDDVRAQYQATRLKLSPKHAIAAISLCLIPALFGFFLPVAVLMTKLMDHNTLSASRGLGTALFNTATIALIGAGLTIILAILLAYISRLSVRGWFLVSAVRIATLGYALPGAVIAIGILTVINWVPGVTTVSAGIMLLLYAYTTRFLTAGYNNVSGGLAQISSTMDAASRTLGANAKRTMLYIHLPLSRNAIAAGALIVFIDITKELPATLLLQPFDYSTIASRVYRLASDERLADAAPAALLLILMGTLAVALLERMTNKTKP